MGDSLAALCAVLGDEARVCGALSGVLRAERAAAIELDADAIAANVAERRTLQEQLARLAATRRQLVRSLTGEHGATGEHVTELLPLLPAESGRRVRERLRALRRAVLDARSVGRQHALFAASSLDGIGEMLHLLGSFLPGAHYGADARVAASGGPTNRIDRRV